MRCTMDYAVSCVASFCTSHLALQNKTWKPWWYFGSFARRGYNIICTVPHLHEKCLIILCRSISTCIEPVVSPCNCRPRCQPHMLHSFGQLFLLFFVQRKRFFVWRFVLFFFFVVFSSVIPSSSLRLQYFKRRTSSCRRLLPFEFSSSAALAHP